MATDACWIPPKLHTEEDTEEERKVTWLELFYDLVYVAMLIQLGNALSDDVSLLGFLKFVAIFIPIWWSWTGFTFYVNRFIVDDIWHRLLVFTQIFFVTVLAISVGEAFGALASQFALAYVGIRVVLIILYYRAGRHVEQARPLANRYAVLFGIAAAVWFVSAFVPAPINYILWGIAMLIDISTPLWPKSREVNTALPPDVEHMTERYGLFTIIVLGESFVKVITDASGSTINTSAFIFSIFGLTVTYSLWWVYFDDIAGAEIKPISNVPYAIYLWLYSHLPVAIGLTAFGVAAKKLYTAYPGEPLDDKYRLLACAALIIYLVFVAIIDLVMVRKDDDRDSLNSRVRSIYRFASAGVILLVAIFGSGLGNIPIIMLLAAATATPIIIDLTLGPRSKTKPPAIQPSASIRHTGSN